MSRCVFNLIKINPLLSPTFKQAAYYQHCSYGIMVKAKKFTIAKLFDGIVKESDFSLQEEELPALKNGEFLAEALYLSVDPYQRAYQKMLNYQVGQTMIGRQIAKVTESKNDQYPKGTNVVGNFGMRTHTVVDPKDYPDRGLYKLPDFGANVPLSLGLGVLGMPGVTAYWGFLDNCRPKPGEIVVVSGAAGAVGSIVGQIAKIKGCKVIGIAGSDEKGEWLKSLGFDDFINYKKSKKLDEDLAKISPEGYDSYFDNVGGEMSSIITYKLRRFGRIAVCGCISTYNEQEMPKATCIQRAMINNLLEMRGLHVSNYSDRYDEAILQLAEWIRENKIQYKETIYNGFNKMPEAFIGLFTGENFGKAVVKV